MKEIDKTTSDRELWSNIVKGKRDALAELFTRYHSQLYAYGYNITHRGELAEDAIQEVFIYLWNKRTSISITSQIKSYLYRAVRNHILNEVDRERRVAAKEDELMLVLPSQVFSPEEVLISEEQQSRRKLLVQEAIQQLSPRQRETLYLRTYSNLNYTEIATVLNVSSQTARNTVSAAYKRLYKRLLLADLAR